MVDWCHTVVDHTLPGNSNKLVVDIEDKIVVVVAAVACKYHWMMVRTADQVPQGNVILVVCFVARDHLPDKHASCDYFQSLMLLEVHSVYHRYFSPRIQRDDDDP